VTGPERLEEHAQRCPDCGSEETAPDVHREDCPRIGSVLQYGPPWLLLPDSWPGRR
jgi:uncharacterized paraquat-inducible protein A